MIYVDLLTLSDHNILNAVNDKRITHDLNDFKLSQLPIYKIISEFTDIAIHGDPITSFSQIHLISDRLVGLLKEQPNLCLAINVYARYVDKQQDYLTEIETLLSKLGSHKTISKIWNYNALEYHTVVKILKHSKVVSRKLTL